MVSVAALSLADSGAISLGQAMAVVAGANVGTCLTPHLISWASVETSWPLASLGFGLMLAFRSKALGHLGRALVGLAMLVTAVEAISWCLGSSGPGLARFVALAAAPWAAFLAGIMLTALIQSSSASLALLMAVAEAGLVPLNGCIAYMLGCNVGTCSTAAIASIASSVTGKRVAAGHFILNLAGAMAVMPFLIPFVDLVRCLTPVASQQVATANTLFNVASTLAALPLLGCLVRASILVVPGKKERAHAPPKHTGWGRAPWSEPSSKGRGSLDD
jgi:phosphate:Na+ symporter